MKHLKIQASAMALFAIVSCSQNNVEVASPLEDSQVTLTAIQGWTREQTKTQRQEDGSVFWTPNDEISLFYGSGVNGGSRFVSQNTDVVAIANFTGTIGVITGGGDNMTEEDTYFWGVYPYSTSNVCDGVSVTTTLPSNQSAVAGTFSDDLFITVGRAEGLSMAFYNLCGGVKFTLEQSGIRTVTFKGNGNETIAGRAVVKFDENGHPVVSEVLESSKEIALTLPDGSCFIPGETYYFVTFPTAFNDGITMSFYKDDERGARVYSKSVSVKRSTFGSLKNFDVGATFIDAINFSDINFKSQLLAATVDGTTSGAAIDADHNGEISKTEAAQVTKLVIYSDNVTSLKGIEYFTNLAYLSVTPDPQKWTVSAPLASVDLSRNTNLTTLICCGNSLTALDLTENIKLRTLDISDNPLTSINLSENLVLNELICDDTDIETINLSANSALKTLSVCGHFTSLDLSGNDALESLDCSGNGLTTLSLSNNTLLKTLDCSKNNLSTLVISSNTALQVLDCSSNNLTDIDFSMNNLLQTIYCYNNRIIGLDVSSNKNLTMIDCAPMNDAAGNNTLINFYIAQNQTIPYINDSVRVRSDEFIPEQTVVKVKGGGSEGTGDEDW